MQPNTMKIKSLPRIRVIKCDIWGSKGDDYKKVLLGTRRRAVWHTFTSLSGKIVSCTFSKPYSSGSYRHVAKVQGLRNSQWERNSVSHSPAPSPGSPPSLYEYRHFSMWILFYHEKGGNEFLQNANIYLPNYTTSHPQDNISQQWKKIIAKKQTFFMSNRFFVNVKGKGKFQPRTGHEGPEGGVEV